MPPAATPGNGTGGGGTLWGGAGAASCRHRFPAVPLGVDNKRVPVLRSWYPACGCNGERKYAARNAEQNLMPTSRARAAKIAWSLAILLASASAGILVAW